MGKTSKTKMPECAFVRGNELYLYDAIGDWPGQVEAIAMFLAEMTGETLDVRIHSFGGGANDGIALHNALRRVSRNGVRVRTHNDGAAYSAAALVFLAGDERYMAANASFMIHKAYFPDGGDIDESENRQLAVTNEGIERILAEATGASAETIGEWLAGDTWMNANDALAAGFATEIESLAAIAAAYTPGVPGNTNTEAEPMAENTQDGTPPVAPEETNTAPAFNLDDVKALFAEFPAEIVAASVADGSLREGCERRKAEAEAQDAENAKAEAESLRAEVEKAKAEIQELRAQFEARPQGAPAVKPQDHGNTKPVGAVANIRKNWKMK